MTRTFTNTAISTAPASSEQVGQDRARQMAQRIGAAARPQGPGWFASSWDLTSGLEVHEGLPADARLGEWLDAWLCVQAAAGSPRAERNEQPRTGLVPAAPHGSFVDPLQLSDLDFAIASEVAHFDEFGQFRIDGLELA